MPWAFSLNLRNAENSENSATTQKIKKSYQIQEYYREIQLTKWRSYKIFKKCSLNSWKHFNENLQHKNQLENYLSKRLCFLLIFSLFCKAFYYFRWHVIVSFALISRQFFGRFVLSSRWSFCVESLAHFFPHWRFGYKLWGDRNPFIVKVGCMLCSAWEKMCGLVIYWLPGIIRSLAEEKNMWDFPYVGVIFNYINRIFGDSM